MSAAYARRQQQQQGTGLTLTSVLGTPTPQQRSTQQQQQQQQEQMVQPAATPGSDLTGIGDYVFDRTVGEGQFGKVKLATHKLSGMRVAIKIVNKLKLTADTLRMVRREVAIMKMLRHPNIIRLYEVIDTPELLFLVMEYAPGGEIMDLIMVHGRLKESDAVRFFAQTAYALAYCHSRRTVHRDVKAENVLLDANMNAKLIDFGPSTTYDPSDSLKTFCGSPTYASPELVQRHAYTGPEVDCWSLGVLLYVLVVGELPFVGESYLELYRKIIAARYWIPPFLSPACKDLLQRMLVPDVRHRATIHEICTHPWVVAGGVKVPRQNLGFVAPPPTADDLDTDVLDKMVEMGFDRQAVISSVLGELYDEAAATYCLLANMRSKNAQRHHHQQKAIADAPSTQSAAATATTATTAATEEESTATAPTSECGDKQAQDQDSAAATGTASESGRTDTVALSLSPSETSGHPQESELSDYDETASKEAPGRASGVFSDSGARHPVKSLASSGSEKQQGPQEQQQQQRKKKRKKRATIAPAELKVPTVAVSSPLTVPQSTPVASIGLRTPVVMAQPVPVVVPSFAMNPSSQESSASGSSSSDEPTSSKGSGTLVRRRSSHKHHYSTSSHPSSRHSHHESTKPRSSLKVATGSIQGQEEEEEQQRDTAPEQEPSSEQAEAEEAQMARAAKDGRPKQQQRTRPKKKFLSVNEKRACSTDEPEHKGALLLSPSLSPSPSQSQSPSPKPHRADDPGTPEEPQSAASHKARNPDMEVDVLAVSAPPLSKPQARGYRSRKSSVAKDADTADSSSTDTPNESEPTTGGEEADEGAALSRSKSETPPTGSSASGAATTPTTPMSTRSKIGKIVKWKRTVAESQPSDASEHPRAVRFAFSVNMTSMLGADEILAIIKAKLAENPDWQVHPEKKYLLRCTDTSGGTKLVFDVEVCRLPLLSVNGVRFHRVTGDSWRYKAICKDLSSSLQLA